VRRLAPDVISRAGLADSREADLPATRELFTRAPSLIECRVWADASQLKRVPIARLPASSQDVRWFKFLFILRGDCEPEERYDGFRFGIHLFDKDDML